MNLVTRGMRAPMLVTRGFMPGIPMPMIGVVVCSSDTALTAFAGDRSLRCRVSDRAFTMSVSDREAPC